MRKGIVIAVMLAGSALAMPAASGATMTIGANLAAAAPTSSNCNPAHQCTVMQGLAPLGALALPVGPVAGTIVGWRVRTGAVSTEPVRLRVLRGSGIAGFYTGAGASAPVTTPVNQISPTIPADLQIRWGDGIGLDCCRDNTNSVTGSLPGPGANYLVWGTGTNALLGEGETRGYNFSQPEAIVLVQADVEPANDPDPGKIRLRGKTVKVSVDLPNQGELTVKGAKKGLVKPKTMTVLPGEVLPKGGTPVKLKLGASVRRKLSQGDTVKLKLRFLFTPRFGVQGVDTAKGKLKP